MTESLHKFITAFVKHERRNRYLYLLNNAKRRDEGLRGLLHDTRHLDMKKFTRLPDLKDLNALVAEQLKRLGVKEPGYVLAERDDLDGQMVELSKFLLESSAEDAAIFFPKANAGYYYNHECERYVFSAAKHS